jgi:N-acetyl-beta-hexosaminidase
LGKEGYMLTISPFEIRITANMQAGLFCSVQSLIQLFRWKWKANETIALTCAKIEMPVYDKAVIASYPWLGSTDVPT